MNWLLIMLQFLPTIVDLAEKLFVNKGDGPQKKAFVLEALPTIAKNIEAVSTGGQKETWKVINDNIAVIGKVIDVTASIMFPPEEHDDIGN